MDNEFLKILRPQQLVINSYKKGQNFVNLSEIDKRFKKEEDKNQKEENHLKVDEIILRY